MTEQELELQRKIIERKRVLLARDEMQFRILEREAEITRLNQNIGNQEARAAELEAEITTLQGNKS